MAELKITQADFEEKGHKAGAGGFLGSMVWTMPDVGPGHFRYSREV